MSLSARDVEVWIQDYWVQHKDYKLMFTAGRIPDNPDKACSIVRASNPRLLHAGAFEEIIYRFHSRGQTQKPDNAEQIAEDIQQFLDGQNNVIIGNTYVTSVSVSSGPRLLTITDPQSRYNHTADYRFISAR